MHFAPIHNPDGMTLLLKLIIHDFPNPERVA